MSQEAVVLAASFFFCNMEDRNDAELRRIHRSYLPFGGVQILMIGDLQQLPPIAHGEEEMILKQHYKSLYFFDSKALQNFEYSSIELKNVYRQNASSGNIPCALPGPSPSTRVRV